MRLVVKYDATSDDYEDDDEKNPSTCSCSLWFMLPAVVVDNLVVVVICSCITLVCIALNEFWFFVESWLLSSLWEFCVQSCQIMFSGFICSLKGM